MSSTVCPEERDVMTMHEPEPEFIPFLFPVNGVDISIVTKNTAYEEQGVDPCFFEESYGVAGSTGFQLWEGAKVLMAYLMSVTDDDANSICGRRAVELGSGTGLVGLGAAAIGAHVVMTDMDAVVSGLLNENMRSNFEKVGGRVATAGLDWLRSVDDQFPTPLKDEPRTNESFLASSDPRLAEVVLAADTCWLKELLLPFVTTLCSVMLGSSDGSRPDYALLAFRDRSTSTSETFVTTAELLAALGERGCVAAVVHTAPAVSGPGSPTIHVYKIVMS
eukprot:TRINITY_DN12679_c0_g1_i1.p2 TRINITY_DN12679_c0_g1~~TRINITY_DN12679_c0_g1_i1.p2  ORF type:complete len:277 (+),score=46.33 TRINITY_DN12679_c0_g1_i1:117-947(+)